MRILVIIAILACAMPGCNKQPIARKAPRVVLSGLRRDDDQAFSAQERRMIAAARKHLESEAGQPVDAYYRVSRSGDHFEVYVAYVTAYQDDEPVFIPGGFCEVWVDEDESVIRVLPGA